MPIPDIDLTVYPDDCDAFGHLNQAAFLSLFERARWEMLARGPGMDVFTRANAWPAVRKTTIDYHAPAFPGDVLRFQQALTHHGQTSFTMRQTARRVADDSLIATAEFVFVCINREGRPVPVPVEVARFMNARPSSRGEMARLTVNGVNLAVDIRGDGPAILFVHGYPLDRTIWQHQVGALTGWRRIAPDLRGFGLSDAPDLGYSMATWADDLAALLDALGVEQAVLCGHSMGGYIGFEFARRHRARLRALVLVDSRAEADTAEGKRAREAAMVVAREQGPRAIAAQMLPKMLAPGAAQTMPQVADRVRGIMESAPLSGILGALGAMRDRPDSTPLLPELAGVPTLAIVGEQDELTPPPMSRAIVDRVPGAVLGVIPNAGHLPPVEQPLATTRVLGEFLDSLH
ncbi:MAG TPA: alpha/beta fold hydrolase [Gemmatimonadales bacterium]|nr:alpha/beta fold hydrolase [Gemmatimonadales bacterium]